MLMVLALPLFASQASAALPLTPVPDFIPVNDENGADDQPGQKDLSLQGVATPTPGDLWVMWQWDVTALSGGNTGDACALFDTNSNAKVNFAVCVTIEKDPAVQAAVSPRVYTCGDGKVDRCTSTYTQITPINTACATNRDATDPFHAGQMDTQAVCHVSLADVGGTSVAKLVNTCSYPSQTPTSAPSDCVLIPRDAFITIVKNATPNNTGTVFPFRLGTGTAATNPVLCNITNSGSCQTIAVRSGIAYNLKEDIPTNWGLDTPAPACTGASGSGTSNGSVSGDTISNITAASDNVITCTYTDKQLTGAIKVTKLHSGTTTTLSGAVFTIGSFTGLTTSADGTVCQAGLPVGASYNVTETAAPNGYNLASPVSQSVSVTSAGTCATGATTVSFSDPVVKGTINIHKQDGNGVDLPGATFTLYTNNAPLTAPRGDSVADPITTLSCTTAAGGNCSIGSVPLGDYWVVETGVPNGYIKATDRAVNVGLGTSPGTGDTDALTFVDPAAAGMIIIHKKGLNGGDLAGATFTLYLDNAPTGGSLGLNDQATANTCLSTGSGTCTLTEVLPGDYWLVETTTPGGYDTAAPTSVNVPFGSGAGQGATVEVNITDPVVPGTINIHKTGIGGSDLNGATFTLYVDNPTVGGTRTGVDTITTKTCTTSGSGNCSITNVAPGNYWVVETTVPNGYTAAPEQAVNVGVGTTAHVGDSDSLTFADAVVNGKVTITKKDDANNALSGAEFTLYTDVTPFGGSRNLTNPDPITNPVKKCTTAGGTCEITGVAPGRYWVVETVTPAHYVTAADQAITVAIGNAPGVGDNVPVSFTDVRKDRVIVLVCSEGTDTLNSRDVTVNGIKKQSLTAGSRTAAEQKALCDLGGASYGDIAGKPDVNALIELSKNSAP